MQQQPHIQNQIGRLTFRIEGDLWNAYHAPISTMDGAVLLGSIRLVLITQSPELKQAFITLMRNSILLLIGDVEGVNIEFNTVIPAPEHEKGGHC